MDIDCGKAVEIYFLQSIGELNCHLNWVHDIIKLIHGFTKKVLNLMDKKQILFEISQKTQ